MSVAVFNRCWARVILTTLTRYGVKHICIAPGSRSTPLTMEAIRLADQGVTCHTHFDERGLGFFALGLSKVDKIQWLLLSPQALLLQIFIQRLLKQAKMGIT